MQSRPEILPSEGALATKLSSMKESFKLIKKNKNLWLFFASYCTNYGTFVAFVANCNFIMKPFDYADIQIALNVVMLMLVGTSGSIFFSLYLKRTGKYAKTLRVAMSSSSIMFVILCVWLNTINSKIITTLIISCMGFFATPTVPICY